MRRSSRRRALTAVASLTLALLGLVRAGEARADRIVLRGGGQVRGKVTPDPKHPDRVIVLTERGKTPLSFQRAQIVEVIAEAGPLDDYLLKRSALAANATAEGQFALGQWCEQHKLPDLATVHYEATLTIDRNFGPAHQKLGHVRYEDRWLTQDERREAQGLVRYKGRWITREEKERRDKEAAERAEQEIWVRRLRMLREAIVYSSEDRRREAESQLMAIREPLAIRPLVQVFGRDATPLRVLMTHVLGSIPGPEATAALVDSLLGEGESEVRNSTMDELLQRKGSAPEIARTLTGALRSRSSEVVNRAAWGLANLDAVSSVPKLIGALFTVRYEMVLVPSAAGAGEGLGISATFGSIAPTPVSGGAPLAYGGSSIAFSPGAAALPAPAVPTMGGSASGSRGPTFRMIAIPQRNIEVLAALVKLTGNDFGWDIDAWGRWLRTSYTAEPRPARHVPQP